MNGYYLSEGTTKHLFFLYLSSALCLGTWPMSLFSKYQCFAELYLAGTPQSMYCRVPKGNHSVESQTHVNVKSLGSEYGENNFSFM
jgi:hypothetical protein